MRILYFAWLAQRMGVREETVDPPADVRTLSALVDWLSRQSPRHEAAFADRSAMRAAINYDYAKLDRAISQGDEIAFFPPVTGG